MSKHKTSNEIKSEHIDVMGEELGEVYHALWNELAWLYSKWKEYVILFGSKPSRIDLINQASSHFFRVVQDSLWDDALLHIARLTDSPKSMGKENLTIRALPSFIEDASIVSEVENLIEQAIKKAEFSRDWRNRRLAHKDLGLALQSGVEPLKPASRTKVNDALSAISDVLNSVSKNYLDSTTMFELIDSSKGAESLLYIIDDGLQAEKERIERAKSGKYSESDLQRRDL